MNRRLLIELLCPPRCISCGKLLPPAVGNEPTALCDTCGEAWASERIAECPTCFQLLSDCRCVPRLMQRAGISAHVKLVPYGETGGGRVTRNVIYTIKQRGAYRAFHFLARELKPGLLAAVREAKSESAPTTETVITFLPRTVEAKRTYGYDQAERLARALSRATGLRYMSLLARRRAALLQKTLNQRERLKNIKGAFALRREVAGLRVIVVDDVVTTGAGMAEAAKLLYSAKAADVIAVSVALTKKNKV